MKISNEDLLVFSSFVNRTLLQFTKGNNFIHRIISLLFQDFMLSFIVIKLFHNLYLQVSSQVLFKLNLSIYKVH